MQSGDCKKAALGNDAKRGFADNGFYYFLLTGKYMVYDAPPTS